MRTTRVGVTKVHNPDLKSAYIVKRMSASWVGIVASTGTSTHLFISKFPLAPMHKLQILWVWVQKHFHESSTGNCTKLWVRVHTHKSDNYSFHIIFNKEHLAIGLCHFTVAILWLYTIPIVQYVCFWSIMGKVENCFNLLLFIRLLPLSLWVSF